MEAFPPVGYTGACASSKLSAVPVSMGGRRATRIAPVKGAATRRLLVKDRAEEE